MRQTSAKKQDLSVALEVLHASHQRDFICIERSRVGHVTLNDRQFWVSYEWHYHDTNNNGPCTHCKGPTKAAVFRIEDIKVQMVVDVTGVADTKRGDRDRLPSKGVILDLDEIDLQELRTTISQSTSCYQLKPFNISCSTRGCKGDTSGMLF